SGTAEPASLSVIAVLSTLLGVLVVFTCFSGIPAIILGRRALREIRSSDGLLRGRWLAIIGIALGCLSCLLPIGIILSVPFLGPGEATRRVLCGNNLKQIALAMHQYEENHGTLPPAAIIDGAGRPLLSWRVAILPYLELGSLYSKFDLDEPWDSPHNRSLIDLMPNVYRCPSDSEWTSGMANYQVVVGPRTAFPPDFKGMTIPDFTDGTNGTILVSETLHGVPWTKPDDLSFVTMLPSGGLGSDHGSRDHGGFQAAFVDGSVRFLKSSIPSEVLRSLLTRNGGERIAPDRY
ncbi:DUF1559 family PulG-like putative transporter, partial [Singulisphaera rosea]